MRLVMAREVDMRCEGWRRYGAMSLGGTGKWEQCKSEAVVMLEVRQEKVEKLPACQHCHDEAKSHGIEILTAEELAP